CIGQRRRSRTAAISTLWPSMILFRRATTRRSRIVVRIQFIGALEVVSGVRSQAFGRATVAYLARHFETQLGVFAKIAGVLHSKPPGARVSFCIDDPEAASRTRRVPVPCGN